MNANISNSFKEIMLVMRDLLILQLEIIKSSRLRKLLEAVRVVFALLHLMNFVAMMSNILNMVIRPAYDICERMWKFCFNKKITSDMMLRRRRGSLYAEGKRSLYCLLTISNVVPSKENSLANSTCKVLSTSLRICTKLLSACSFFESTRDASSRLETTKLYLNRSTTAVSLCSNDKYFLINLWKLSVVGGNLL